MSIRSFAVLAALGLAGATLAGCQQLPSPASTRVPTGGCDVSIGAIFDDDSGTSVVKTRAFKAGDLLALSGDDPGQAIKAARDVCLIKLNVGPGNPGPEGAPSTSKGIGIEIWLPAPEYWNERIHALGGGGFQGGAAGSPDNIGNPMAAAVAFGEGAVSSSTDAGHASVPKNYGIPDSGGDFLMNPDGSIAANLWHDFSVRAIHEQALKTKAVTRAFYGKPARYAYWDGSSTGGRQGHKLAQAHPDDFDGIIANLPALHWTSFTPAMLYPHLVFQRDLGGKPLTREQQDLVSNAAIRACDIVGGQHLGYITDPAACRYDPTTDADVLCTSDGGSSKSEACVTKVQARAINKIWYGPTTDGSAPDPAVDNGWMMPPQGKHLWYGVGRGTSLWNRFFTTMLGQPAGVANPESAPFLGTHPVALALCDPAIAGPDFRNALSNGKDGWKSLSYQRFAESIQKGNALSKTAFSGIDTDDPDLSGFEESGGKLLFWHGTNDEVIPVQGSMQYYDSVVRAMGSLERVQNFYRFYVVPGAGHQSPNGTSNPAANPPVFPPTRIYELLVDWVENGVAPERVELSSSPGNPVGHSAPVCPYPARASYTGGDPTLASNYVCQK